MVVIKRKHENIGCLAVDKLYMKTTKIYKINEGMPLLTVVESWKNTLLVLHVAWV